MRLKKILSLLLISIMALPSAFVMAEDAPFPVVNVSNKYDISDSLDYFGEFDYSDPQHITDELLFGEWDEENECWIPQYNSVVIKNNLQDHCPEMADMPLINYDYDPKLKAVEEAVKTCGGNYQKPKALLLEYYREKFTGFNLEITPSGTTATTLSCNALAYNYFTGNASLIKMFDMKPEETTYSIDIKGNVSSVVDSLSTSKLALILSAVETDGQAAYFYSTESEYAPVIVVDLSDGNTERVYPTYDLTISGGKYASQNFADDVILQASERKNPDSSNDDNSAKAILQFDFSFVPDGVKVLAARLEISGYTDKTEGNKKMVLATESEINLVEQSEVTWSKFDNLGTSYSTFPGEMVTTYGFSGLGYSDTLAKRYLYDNSEIYAYHAMRLLLSAHIEFDGNPFVLSPISPLLAQCGTAKLLAGNTYALINSKYMTPEAFGMLLKSVYHHAEWLIEGWDHGLLNNNHATYYNQGFSGLVTLFPEFDKADDPMFETGARGEFYEGGKGGWIECLQQRALVKVRDLAAADFSGKEASMGYSREAFRNAASVMQNASATHMEELLPDEYYDKMAQAALYFVYGTAPGYYDWNTGDCYGPGSNFIHGRPTIKATIDALEVLLEEMPDKESDYYKQRLEWYNHLVYAYYSETKGEMPEFQSILYPFTRNLIMRDGWSEKSVGATMINNNGNVHGHFDDLNIIVTAYGEELLADSGKPVYTRNDPTRAWQLSTRGHNTIEINDTTQRGYMSNNWEVVKGPWGENIILPFRDSHGVTHSEIATVTGIEEPENAHIKEMVDNRNYTDANLNAIYDMDDKFAIGEKAPEECNLQGRFLEAELTESYDYSKAETYSNINVEYYDDGDVLGNGKKTYQALDNAHNRSLLFIKTQLSPRFFIVTDYVAPVNGNTEVNKYAQGWHFNDRAKITLDETTKETRTHFGGANIAVVPVIGKDVETEAEIKTGLYTNGDHIPAEYVTYTKYSDKPTTFNTILFPMDSGKDHKIETKLISVSDMLESDASAFSFKITDPDTDKVTEGTYYNMHNLEKKKEVDLGDYYFDGRMLYVDKNDSKYSAAIIADGTSLMNSDEDYLIKSNKNISNMSVEWRGTGIYISTTHTDENDAEYVDLSALTILNHKDTRMVYLNGKSIPYKTSGRYIYFGETPIVEDSGLEDGSDTTEEEQKPDNTHGTGGAGDNESTGSSRSDDNTGGSNSGNTGPGGTGSTGGNGNTGSGSSGSTEKPTPDKDEVKLNPYFEKELQSHWGKTEIEALVKSGVVNGVSDTTLGLSQSVTRAQFAAMLVRALEIDTVKYDGEFNDVKTGDWYADIIATVNKAGIMNGDESKNASPDSILTREQMAKMAVSALEKVKGITAEHTGELPLPDSDAVSPWAKEYVQAAVNLGIMKGISESEFAPLDTVPREQAMVLVYRLMKK